MPSAVEEPTLEWLAAKGLQNPETRVGVTTHDGRIDAALTPVLCSRLGVAVLTNDGT
jgi:hypothetical protein